jgi:hypothetical protein
MKGKEPAKFERNMLDKIMKNTSEEKKKMMMRKLKKHL